MKGFGNEPGFGDARMEETMKVGVIPSENLIWGQTVFINRPNLFVGRRDWQHHGNILKL